MISVKFPDFKKLAEQRIERKVKAMDQIVQFEATLIRDRTAKGLDYERKKFKAVSDNTAPGSRYSKGYAKKRQKNRLGISFINLNFTGKMMQSIRPLPVKKLANGWQFAIGFSDRKQAEKMIANHKQGRVFFRISKKREQEIVKKVRDA